jgi:hypothetical protein
MGTPPIFCSIVPVVEKCKVYGKTNVPEFAASLVTCCLAVEKMHNTWDI